MTRDKMCAKEGRKGIKSIARCAAILVAGAFMGKFSDSY